MDVKEIVKEIWEFNLSGIPEVPLWPCFVGEAGTGKTSRAKQLAAETGRIYIPFLLHHHLPEDVGGFPRPILEQELVKFLATEEIKTACEKPTLLFLDELDKPDPQVVSTVLSLLSERRFRWSLNLHPQTVILGAMQPNDLWLANDEKTREAMASRFVWLPIVNDWSYIAHKYQLDADELANIFGKPKMPQYYLANPNNRTISWLCGFFLQYRPDLLYDEKFVQTILAGTLPAKEATAFFHMVTTRAWTDYEKVAKDPKALDFAIKNWSAAQLVELFPYVFAYTDEPRWMDIQERLLELDPSVESWNAAIRKFAEWADRNLSDGVLEVGWIDDNNLEYTLENLRRHAELVVKAAKMVVENERKAAEEKAKATKASSSVKK